jgi:hypothetical protein
MDELEFNFGEDSFNKLFPFFILVDSSLTIKGIGKVYLRFAYIKNEDDFSDNFLIQRPFVENITYQGLIDNLDQLIVIAFKRIRYR